MKNSGRGGSWPGVAGEARNSALGQIKNAQRSRMKHATSDRLVYLHESFHLMQRMQNAGWSADVERWESDSDCDSDDSEGEAEADPGLTLRS